MAALRFVSMRSVVSWVLGALAGTSAPVVSQSPPSRPAASFVLPIPTGEFSVGTTRWVVDSTAARPLVVTAWYPATSAALRMPSAPYLREESALRTMTAWGKNPGAMFLRHAGVVTHGHVDAPVAGGARPVVVFSHGYLDQPNSYTALMEDLASRGYAVISVAHTGETMAVSLPHDSVSSVFRVEGGLQADAARVVAEWGAEDSVATVVTSARSASAAETHLRAYLQRIPASNAAVDRWADDIRRVIDDLGSRNERGSTSLLARHLDLQRIGVAGHSMGGVASAAFCARDRRCRAAINLDGTPQYGDLIDHPSRTPFLMVYGSRPGRIGVSDVVYEKGANYWRADVAGALHLNFGDWQYWPPGSPVASSVGPISPAECTAVVHRLVREFLRFTLDRESTPLFAGRISLPSLTLTQRTNSALR